MGATATGRRAMISRRVVLEERLADVLWRGVPTSGSGTFRKCWRRHAMSDFEGIAENVCSH